MGALYRDALPCSLHLLCEVFQHHISFVQHLYNTSSSNALISSSGSFSQFISLLLIERSVERSLCTFRSEPFDWAKFWTTCPESHEILTGLHFTGAFVSLRADSIFGFLSQKFDSLHFVFVVVASFKSFVDSLENFLLLIELLFLWSSLCRGSFLVLSLSYYYSVLLTTWSNDFFSPPRLFLYCASWL